MPLWVEIGLAVVLGPVLWLAGAIFFDFAHFVLHGMLRSRSRLLRALAWPHGVHHRWIDRNLEVQWDFQRRNVWCHIVPEYLTQLPLTAFVAFLLPLPFAIALFGLQTLVFVSILRARGLDLNHRPIEMLDAYRPGPWTPPAYHALHHVYPDAYFSAYTKAIDFLVRGAAQLRERRFVFAGPQDRFASALRESLEGHGVEAIDTVETPDEARLADANVLVLPGPEPDAIPWIEAFVDATRGCKLPPEVWVVHATPEAPAARHYLGDVRLHYRALLVPDAGALTAAATRRAAQRAVSRIRRGCHVVPTGGIVAAFVAWWRFRSTPPAQPAQARTVRHRTELQIPG
ncbi:MAG: hypothetical protein ABFS41_13555 [Myxococcota bacterium]